MDRTPLLKRTSETRETSRNLIPISLMDDTFEKFNKLIKGIESRLEIEKEQTNQIRDDL